MQRAEKKLYLDQMVNRGVEAAALATDASPHPNAQQQIEQLTSSEMLSMLRFGAQCCFGGGGGDLPSPEQLDAIIDRTRSANDSVGDFIAGGQQRSAALMY